MDSVRFGRALGVGARSAAKVLAEAAEAATAPNPSPIVNRPPPPDATASPDTPVTGPIASAARNAARATIHARTATQGVARGGKRFGEAVWGPFVKLSGVIWLEITGVFFGIFALFAGQAVWAHRTDLYSVTANGDARLRTFVFLAMALGFTYFCLSNFIRARRRERRD